MVDSKQTEAQGTDKYDMKHVGKPKRFQINAK